MKVFQFNLSLLKRILIVIAIALTFITITSVSWAVTVRTPIEVPKFVDPNQSRILPDRDTSGATGVLPQYWGLASSNPYREVTLDDSRLLLKTNTWQATVSNGSVVYCASYHDPIRYGTWDPDTHYLIPEGTAFGLNTSKPFSASGLSIQDQLDAIKEYFEKYYNNDENGLKGYEYYIHPGDSDKEGTSDETEHDNYKIEVTSSFENTDALGYVLFTSIFPNVHANMNSLLDSYEAIKSHAQAESQSNLEALFQAMSIYCTGGKISHPTDPPDDWVPNVTATQGPAAVVVEQEEHASDGYAKSEEGDFSNDAKSFVFSASENAYSTPYATKYTLNDIQSAYWLLLHDEGGEYPSNITANGQELYEKAKQYKTFLEQDYNPTIDSSKAQAIADRNRKEYIIGPYTLNYPMLEDISYVKSISVNDKDDLIYDYDHEGIKLVIDGKGTVVPGSNGLMKEYPQSGQKFFVVFSAEKAGMPTNVNLNVRFEHIQDSGAHYESYTAETHTYRYEGYCMIGDEKYNMETATVTVKVTAPKGIATATKHEASHPDPCKYGRKDPDTGETIESCNQTPNCRGAYTNYANKASTIPDTTFELYIPYIKMSEDVWSSKKAQTLTVITGNVSIPGGGSSGSGGSGSSGSGSSGSSGSGSSGGSGESSGSGSTGASGNAYRTYEVVLKTDNIDLTMELGGYVWADEEGGKESVANGTYDSSEKRVPHIKVTLSDGQTTTTDENGEYRFKGLNAMNTYTVTFEYNGQYYQPTKWEPASTWGSGSWTTNSNAKDNQSEREAFNLKFESIGSSPENYTGSKGANKTFTKQELLGYTLNSNGDYEKTRDAVIDEFGNLIKESASDERTSQMIQYVKDCMMKAYTFDAYPYPSIFLIDKAFTWSNTPKVLMTKGYSGITPLYDNAYYINLGLDAREESDLAIKKDVDHVTLEINGQTHTYTYDTLENKENAEKQWDINVRLSDGYYNTAYSRELYKSDYLYKASMYGDTDTNNDGIGDAYGKSKADELEVYITYKIMVRNQAMSIRAKVNELVDYYDQDLEYVEDRSYIQVKQSRNNALQKGIYSVGASNTSIYSPNTTTKIDGYDALYITGLAKTSNDAKENYLAAGQTAYIYLTFKVKKEARDGEDWVKLDEKVENGEPIGVGKENIIEVNGYATQYAEGTQVPNIGDVSFKPAGIVDTDSNPGNLADTGIQKDKADTSVFAKFEDDTDKAPNIRIVLHRDDEATRVISGSVWEDARTQDIEVTTTGDGFKDEEATMINGVTVQLVELMENGTEYVWREFGDNAVKQGELGGQTTIGKGSGSGTVASETPIINAYNLVEDYKFAEQHNGQYAFKSFMPGKYIIRFIYGDTVKTVTPASLNMGGLNEKSYNGQDYKSTTYQKGVDQNKVYTWREPSTWSLGQETLGKVITEVSTFKPDASNNETTNAKLSATEQKGYLYDITASDKQNNVSDAKDIESRRNIVNDYSDNDVINHTAEVLASHKADYATRDDRAQLLNELMQNTKMTAETGLMVIELEYDKTGTPNQTQNNKASYKIQNVDLGLEERPKAQLVIDKEVTNVKLTLADGSILFDAKNTASNVLWKEHKAYQVGYKGNVMDPAKFGNLQNIRNKNASKFGLVQLTMDEELMHGATIEIAYQVTLTNIGEVDYKDNLFYYTGNKSDSAQVVTTRANQVIDYVANNLQFNASNNSNWKVIEKNVLNAEEAKDSLVNNNLKAQVEKYNTVIVTEALSKDLVPSLYKEKVKSGEDSVSVPLVLTQLITTENDTDDLTYRNLVEIVKTSNTIGRRMEYSVVGNQDPEANPQELDSDIAEVVRILPPFGRAINYILLAIIAIVVISIATGGIIFIKKKVLKK